MNFDESIPLLSLSAHAMSVQRDALDIFARNVAAAQVAGKNGFTRYAPTITTDESGFPAMSGVVAEHVDSGSIVSEMMAMMQAQRAYEGDATMFSLSKHLAESTIAIERT